jgi:PAS domain S-box-containing protein
MPPSSLDLEVERLRSQVAALEQLLDVREQVVREQSDRLEEALGELRRRAGQLEQSELALRKQTDILRSVLDNLADGVVVADERGKLVLINPAAERMTGMGLKDAEPEQWPEVYGLYLPDGHTPYPANDLPLVRALRGEDVDDAEVFMRHAARPEGLWLSVTARPMRDEQGRPRGAVAVTRDVTGHRRAEEALRNSEALYHSLVESLPVSVFRKDLLGRFTFGNQRFCDGLGRPLADILGKDDCDFFPPELAAKYMADDARVVATRTVFEDVEEHQRPGGERAFVQVLKVPLYDFKGAVVGTQGVFWDVTARKRAEQDLKRLADELARSNAELRQFADVVAHDLHEPMRMVTSYCRLLKRRYQSRLDASADEFLDFAMGGATRMQELLDDLLAYTRTGTQDRPLQPVDCGAVLGQALANLRLAIDEAGAVVTHDPLPTVPGDRPQLVQLFQNLVANAVKFRGTEPPRVHVSARREGPAWRFAVRDNGIGIAPADADRIFVIFQRLHTSQEYAGTGVGLALCKKIVERHHGRIWVESQPGRGSLFCFTLPA